MIKPSQPPQGAKGKQHNRPSPAGNAPLLPTEPPPEGEVLVALCLELLMSPKAERRVDFPLRGKYREAGIGVHFHQAQPGWHVFPRAASAVVWFHQKRFTPYLEDRPPQARRALLTSENQKGPSPERSCPVGLRIGPKI